MKTPVWSPNNESLTWRDRVVEVAEREGHDERRERLVRADLGGRPACRSGSSARRTCRRPCRRGGPCRRARPPRRPSAGSARRRPRRPSARGRSAGRAGSPSLSACGALDELGHERVPDVLVDEHPLDADADLAGVRERADERSAGRPSRGRRSCRRSRRRCRRARGRPSSCPPAPSSASRPTASPVNVRSLNRSSSTIRSPSSRVIGRMLTAPCGQRRPRRRSRRPSASSAGPCDGGLSTIEQPAAIAGASLCAARLSGKLNGEIAATGPIGKRRVTPIRPRDAGIRSSGIVSPTIRSASSAPSRKVSDRPVDLDQGIADRLAGLARRSARRAPRGGPRSRR